MGYFLPLQIRATEAFEVDAAATGEAFGFCKAVDELGDRLREGEDEAVTDLLDHGIAYGIVGFEKGTQRRGLGQFGAMTLKCTPGYSSA